MRKYVSLQHIIKFYEEHNNAKILGVHLDEIYVTECPENTFVVNKLGLYKTREGNVAYVPVYKIDECKKVFIC